MDIGLIVLLGWIACGFAGWAITLSEMRQSWKRDLGRERPDDPFDYLMLFPSGLLGPVALIMALTDDTFRKP